MHWRPGRTLLLAGPSFIDAGQAGLGPGRVGPGRAVFY